MSQTLYKIETAFHRLMPNWLFSPRYCLVYRAPCLTRLPPDDYSSELQMRWAVEADTPALFKRSALNLRRLELGDRAAVVMHGDKLVGKLWIARKVYCDWDTGLRVELAPHEAWLYGVWIHRDLRGKHLYSNLFAFACLSLQQESCQSLLLAVDWSNGLSQRIHEAFGGQRMGSIYGARLLGHNFFRVKNAG